MSEEEKIINIKQRLFGGWIKNNPPRKDIHISHLVHCRRKSCFELLDTDNKTKLEERTFRNFILGASIHFQLQELLGDEFECEKEVI